MLKGLFALGAILIVGAANALIIETESNNTFGTANAVTRAASPWADLGNMRLGGTGGDVDFFSINLIAGEIITIVTTPQPPDFTTPDTLLGLFDNNQTLLQLDDDSGPGLGSLVQWQATYTGTHFFAVTGFPDQNFTGGHSQVGNYVLTVSIVPEPATILALAAGAGLLIARRRRK